MKKFNLTEEQLDSIKEVASIGMSHAANALSKMINRSVMIVVPEVKFFDTKKFTENFFTDKKEIYAGIYFYILGKVTGRLLILFERKKATSLIDILMNKQIGTTKVFSEIEQSCLMETGAILTASCLNALAEFLKMTLLPSVPNFVFDYGESILNRILQEINYYDTGYTFVINSDFKTKENEIEGKFVIFPDEDSLTTIWKTLFNFLPRDHNKEI